MRKLYLALALACTPCAASAEEDLLEILRTQVAFNNYISVTACIKQGFSFNSAELAALKGMIAKDLDDRNVSRERRDDSWREATELDHVRTPKECEQLRANLEREYPKVIRPTNPPPPNPF